MIEKRIDYNEYVKCGILIKEKNYETSLSESSNKVYHFIRKSPFAIAIYKSLEPL